jgi:hypothetical protein
MDWREFKPSQNLKLNLKAKRAKRVKRGVNVPDLSDLGNQLMDELRGLVKALAADYPAGALPWAGKHRPELVQQIAVTEAAIDRAIIDGDEKAFWPHYSRLEVCYRALFAECKERRKP